jgi:1,6-anhydro-N-acetylmuramate kinase
MRGRLLSVVQAIGLMSGTSLDGVDVALIETDGERVTLFGLTAYRPYDMPITFPETTGAPKPIAGGVIAKP